MPATQAMESKDADLLLIRELLAAPGLMSPEAEARTRDAKSAARTGSPHFIEVALPTEGLRDGAPQPRPAQPPARDVCTALRACLVRA